LVFSSNVQADIVVGNGATLVINPGGLFVNLNCQNLIVSAGGTLVVNAADITNVTGFIVNPGGTVQFLSSGSLNTGSWTNDGVVTGLPVFSFNSCSSNTISGSSDTDGDGVSDSDESCLIDVDPNNDGVLAFLDDTHSCTVTPQSIPILNTSFNILLSMLLLIVAGIYSRTRSRPPREN
jgi:hypothetical protein